MRQERLWAGLAAVGLLATGLAWLGRPEPYRLGTATTGDPALAATVRAAIDDPSGHRGLAVALVEDGTVRYAGLGDPGGPEGSRVDQDTAFEIGSVGKALTGMLLAELVRDGTVRADQPLQELLPDTRFDDPDVAGTTLAELTSHRSGLPRVRYTNPGQWLSSYLRSALGGDPYAGRDTGWLLSSVRGADAGSGEPQVRYSNYGVAVLGQALATRTGTPYPDLLRQRILDPLGMDHTGYHLDGAPLPGQRAHGGSAGGWSAAPWRASGYAPAGTGAWSTARDLAALVSAMLAGTAPGADAATARFHAGPDSRIGYGWFTDRVAGQELTWHNGGTGGFRSYVGYDPGAGRGVVVLGNTDRAVDGIGEHLLTGGAAGDTGGDGPGLPALARTLVFSLLGGLGLLFVVTRPVTDRLRLVSNGAVAWALCAIAYPLGAWQAVPGWVWAVGVGLCAVATAVGVRRWRGAPVRIGSPAWLRWPGTAAVVLGAAAVVAWVYA
jgi:CubicO group peptidase (beta-lactamase class C family)